MTKKDLTKMIWLLLKYHRWCVKMDRPALAETVKDVILIAAEDREREG